MEPLPSSVQWTVLVFVSVFVLHLLLVAGFFTLDRANRKDAGHYWRLEEKET